MHLSFLNVMLNWVDAKMKYDEVCAYLFKCVFIFKTCRTCIYFRGIGNRTRLSDRGSSRRRGEAEQRTPRDQAHVRPGQPCR